MMKGGESMNLPAFMNNIGSKLERGDYLNVKKTDTDRVVVSGKHGDVKMSQVIYPTGTIVETKSYKK